MVGSQFGFREETMRSFTGSTVTAIFLIIPFSHSLARTDVYRCVQDDGHVSYQQTRCSFESKPMKLNSRPSGWSALRPGEKDLLNAYRRNDAARNRKSPAGSKQPAAETRECWSRRKQLEAVRAKLHRGYKLKESEALHRARDNYEDYLRRFCS